MTGFAIEVPGKPVGKGRPRFANGRTYTPRETVLAEQGIRSAWEDVGSPRLPDGPVRLRVTIGVERPRAHFKRDGTLTTEGHRHPYPARQKPDVDNVLKMIMDALNSRAWKDDVQVIDGHVLRVWADVAFTLVSAVPVTHFAGARINPGTEAAST